MPDPQSPLPNAAQQCTWLGISLLGGLGVMTVLTVFLMVIDVSLYQLVVQTLQRAGREAIFSGASGGQDNSAFFVNTRDLITVINIAVWIGWSSLFAVWGYQVSGYAHQRSGNFIKTTPVMCLIYMLLPIVGIWMMYQVIRAAERLKADDSKKGGSLRLKCCCWFNLLGWGVVIFTLIESPQLACLIQQPLSEPQDILTTGAMRIETLLQLGCDLDSLLLFVLTAFTLWPVCRMPNIHTENRT